LVGWTVLYGLVVWGKFAVLGLLEERTDEAWVWFPILVSLALAFFAGVRLRSP
jgi:hypothetical protein